jgi:uncharacterized protein YcfL
MMPSTTIDSTRRKSDMRNLVLIPAALATALLAGCHPVNKPIEGRNDPYDRQQVMYAEETLKNQTAQGKPVATRDASGLLFVTVPIRSAINKHLEIQYRFTWFDQNGQVINPGAAWVSKYLTANVPDQITGNSTTSRAAEFQLDIRPKPKE